MDLSIHLLHLFHWVCLLVPFGYCQRHDVFNSTIDLCALLCWSSMCLRTAFWDFSSERKSERGKTSKWDEVGARWRYREREEANIYPQYPSMPIEDFTSSSTAFSYFIRLFFFSLCAILGSVKLLSEHHHSSVTSAFSSLLNSKSWFFKQHNLFDFSFCWLDVS